MVQRITTSILLVLAMALAACGGGEADTTTAVSDATISAELPKDITSPLSMQLSIGTLMLEETGYVVTPAQARELLPLWQMLRALQESGTASEAETEAVVDQIHDAMTPEQLAAIENMSPEEMEALMQELGMRQQGGSDSAEGGGFRPPEDMMPPGEGQVPPGMAPDGLGDVNPEDLAALMADRTSSGLGAALADEVVELLETRVVEL